MTAFPLSPSLRKIFNCHEHIDNITWSFPLFNLFIHFMSWFAKRAQGAEGIPPLVRVPRVPFVSLTYIRAPNK